MSDIFPLFALKVVTYPSSVALFATGCSPLVTLSTGPRFPQVLRKKTWDNRLKKLSASQVAEGVATNGKQTVVYASFGFGCSGYPVSSMARKSIYEYADAQALNVWCIDSANGQPLNFLGITYLIGKIKFQLLFHGPKSLSKCIYQTLRNFRHKKYATSFAHKSKPLDIPSLHKFYHRRCAKCDWNYLHLHEMA